MLETGKAMDVPLWRLVWAIPPVYAAHVVEEAAGGFASWFSGAVGGTMDATGFALSTVCFTAVAVALTAWASITRSVPVVLLLAVWVGAHLFWDPLFHLGATIVQHRYSPGLVTACFACFPLSLALAQAALRQKILNPWALTAAAVVGGALLGAVLLFGGRMPALALGA